MKKNIVSIMTFSSLAMLASCSSLVESTRKMIDGDSPRKQSKQSGWVSKSQYNDLLVKYKNLNEKYESLKEDKALKSGDFDQGFELANKSASEVTAMPDETVDVFGRDGLANQVSASLDQVSESVPAVAIKPLGENELDQEVKTYKKAVVLKDNGKLDDSIKIFQFLEKSPTKQIRVRARVHIGEIYLKQQQYDLALQVFESVIKQDAFSSRVLDALKGAVVSCDKLRLTDKKLRYQSILSDVFGTKG